MKIRFYQFILLSISLFLSSNVLSVERIALVIGNAEYEQSGASLDNPVNDAEDIAASLEAMDFEVILRTDLEKRQIEDAMREFEGLLQRSGEDTVGLFFYAGHAGEVNGINYLYPVDIVFEKKNEGAYDGVPVQRLLDKMQEAKNKMNIIILDACRDNPYAQKSRSISKKPNTLAEMQVPVGSIVAYSTASGKQAADGDGGENGLYTQELLRFIKQPGLKIEDVFKRVRKSVREKSGNAQVAWERSSLEGDFYFLPPNEQAQLVQESVSEESEDSNVSINSNIQGAQIFIDGKARGLSPLTLDDLDEGTVLVKLQKEGFQPVEKKVMIRKSRSIALNFVLRQVPMAHISIKSFPEQAEWYLDGVLIGETPDRMDRIKPGKHQVKILKSGYLPWEQEVNLTIEAMENMNVRLEPLESTEKKTELQVVETEAVIVSKPAAINRGIVIQDKDFAPEMVVISSGQYMMGDSSGNGKANELPAHNVSINKQFAIGKYEVTFEQYDHFADVSGRKKADDFGFGRGKHPAINVSWEDAIAYTKWLTEQTGHKYRLPSEAEWEYVARAGKKTPRYWTDKTSELESDTLACQNANIADLSLKAKKPYQKAHQCNDQYPNTAPVGSFQPNSFGLYDLLGNVAEWTGSFYTTPYKGQELRNDEGDVWGRRSVRGGSYSSQPSDVTVSSRSFQAGAATALHLGFRVVRELDANDKVTLK